MAKDADVVLDANTARIGREAFGVAFADAMAKVLEAGKEGPPRTKPLFFPDGIGLVQFKFELPGKFELTVSSFPAKALMLSEDAFADAAES